LARFVVDIVDQLDLTHLSAAYTGRGSKAFHPTQLVALLFYGYATGVFSSRKVEAATYDSVAFRYLCANTHPDHDTIARFRARFLKQNVLDVLPPEPGAYFVIDSPGQARGAYRYSSADPPPPARHSSWDRDGSFTHG
jgi:hypothetical protein